MIMVGMTKNLESQKMQNKKSCIEAMEFPPAMWQSDP